MHLSRIVGQYVVPFALVLGTCTATPRLSHAFSATVTLGSPVGPITVDGIKEYTVVEPITGGQINGVINGTISGGQAAITVSNSTISRPFVDILGKTDDGVPFYAQGVGVGVPGAQLATISIRIGEPYASLEKDYILATFTDNNQNPPTKSTIEGWIVTRELA